MHPLVKLASQSVKHFIETGKSVRYSDSLPDNFKQKAGTFVTIRNQDSLRGCIDTMSPKYKNLAEEVIRNAIHSANEDLCFNPIEKRKLDYLTFTLMC